MPVRGGVLTMGTCHVLIAPELLELLRGALGYANGVRVQKAEAYGDGRFLALIGSNSMSLGYHGFQAIIVEDNIVRFKAEGACHEDS